MTQESIKSESSSIALTHAKSTSRWNSAGLLVAGIVAFIAIYQLIKSNGPLAWVIDWFTYDLLALDKASHLGGAVNFFFYDTIKISVLLLTVIYSVTLVRQSFNPNKVRRMLSGKRTGIGNIMAAALGVVTPFCSCSACPLFIGFVESGIPLGITFSFLIASPMVNEMALLMLLATFNIKITALYMISGLSIAVIAGLIIGRLGLEDQVERFGINISDEVTEIQTPLRQRSREAWQHTATLMRKVGPWIVGGIALGAIIHGYVPVDFVLRWAGRDNPWAVPIAVILALPLYSNAAGMIPIAQALYAKGMAMGTVLAFFMAVVGLSVPEFIILKQVIKPKLLAIFALILLVSFILIGYLFNAVL